jgi:hypothetical protein
MNELKRVMINIHITELGQTCIYDIFLKTELFTQGLLSFHVLFFPFRAKISVIKLTYYGLDERSSIPGSSKNLSSNLCVQTGSGAHPASCTMGTGGSFLGGKARPGRDADRSPPSSAEVMKE